MTFQKLWKKWSFHHHHQQQPERFVFSSRVPCYLPFGWVNSTTKDQWCFQYTHLLMSWFILKPRSWSWCSWLCWTGTHLVWNHLPRRRRRCKTWMLCPVCRFCSTCCGLQSILNLFGGCLKAGTGLSTRSYFAKTWKRWCMWDEAFQNTHRWRFSHVCMLLLLWDIFLHSHLQ